jgi:hypothetical protein
MPNKRKSNLYSVAEKQYILESGKTIPVEKIAKETQRRAKSIAFFLKKHGITPIWEDEKNQGIVAFSDRLKIQTELRSSAVWGRLKQKFDEDEIRLFEDRYIAYITQFKEDVFATEENQIHKLITYDILMDRNMINRKGIMKEIRLMEDEQEKMVQGAGGDVSKLSENQINRLQFLQTQIVQYRDQERSMSKEYTDLEAHHQQIMKSLKATRDQRINKIESSKMTFIGLIKELQRDEIRNQMSVTHALMEQATNKEFVRLAKVHKYMDGNEDQPLLSAESMDFLEELHKNEGETK